MEALEHVRVQLQGHVADGIGDAHHVAEAQQHEEVLLILKLPGDFAPVRQAQDRVVTLDRAAQP